MKKILLLTLLALCMPVITNANVASYGFAANETEKNEKDATAPKDEMPTDDDLESLRQELLWEVLRCVVDCSELDNILQWKAGDYIYMDEEAIELYREINYYRGVIDELYSHIENASTMEELESCRQQVLELYSNLTQLSKKIEAYIPPYFVAVTKEGVEMTFIIISKEDKTVQVGNGDWSAVSTSTIGEITIPEEVEGYRVIYIAEWAFCGCSLTSVIIPNSVTSIGKWAFCDCSDLTSVTLNSNDIMSVQEDGSTLGSIFGEQVETYIIGDGVTSIGEMAFSDCSGLTSVTIPNSVTSIGSFAFSGCSGLTSITIPNSVTSIDGSAFIGCSGLTSVTIPNSVTSIGNFAFSYCSNLTSIEVESGNTVYDSRDNCNAIIETESNTLFLGCKNTVIPNSVTSIDNGAFYGCSGLTSVTIPNSVTSIGERAFSDCSSLTDVYCLAENVPSTSLSSFEYSPIETATLHVLAGSIDSYKATSPWSGFGNIVPLTDEDGIGEVESSEAKLASSVYNLSGRKQTTAQKGINIIRYPDGTTRKVLVK